MDSSAATPDTTAQPHDHQRVVIIDDHEIFRHGLCDLISCIEGYEVVAEGGSCADALALAGQMDIDLVILDRYLPDGNGTRIIGQLKKQSTHPPIVIILSAEMSDETLVEAMLAGAEGYLTKDMPAEAILASLKGMQEGQLALPAAVTTKLVYLLVQKHAEKAAEPSSRAQEATPLMEEAPLQADRSTPPAVRASASSPLLTRQEARVFELMRNGQSNRQIASSLAISPYTVGKHVQKILRKFGAANRTQAASYTPFEGDERTGK
jgi:DNA-binding NarL/FixJ family response regulator